MVSLMCIGLMSAVFSTSLHANLLNIKDSFSTRLEASSAESVQATYEALILQSGCDDQASRVQSDGNCGGQIFTLFENVRELVHTANEINGTGPTQFSLGVDLTDLGFALRWNASEEYAAQSTASSNFSGQQLSGLASRLNALRMGATGFQIAGFYDVSEKDIAHLYQGSGGGASADASGGFSRLGGFINFNFGSGDRAPSDQEDAFDFDNQQVTLGMDYRLNHRWVLGAIVGILEQDIDFDSTQSIVDGGIDSEGLSFMPFASYQQGALYLSLALGLQTLDFDSERSIRYASLNPDTDSVNTVTVSETTAKMQTLFLEAGYQWRWRQWSFEPSLQIESVSIKIDAFTEEDINNDAFDLVIEEQDFDLLSYRLGMRFQTQWLTKQQVWLPYLLIEYVNNAETDAQMIESNYVNAVSTDTGFQLATDELDDNYIVYHLGLSAVLRGNTQVSASGQASGGLQAFINYQRVKNLDFFDQSQITLGARYEF